ncbi:hypothetical protein GCM10010371_12050 [Streptomyces subrutilus]|uniref:Uncharacterized protein n=1 Tax=Streptomyces subrutilus TaxID=36818 RepID=A0A918QKD9_9ACTN|nr:hypothetical protein GCM10010371_12050 [Streptomyces subrutilus]
MLPRSGVEHRPFVLPGRGASRGPAPVAGAACGPAPHASCRGPARDGPGACEDGRGAYDRPLARTLEVVVP